MPASRTGALTCCDLRKLIGARMGLFFIVLALFGFSCLTSLGVFASERILFMRERANGYYSPYTYFFAKVRRSFQTALTAQMLFDTIPLRVVPPFILGAIIYKPVGLVPSVPEFWKLILILVLFNLVASSAVFLISIVVADTGVANLLGSLVMLFKCVVDVRLRASGVRVRSLWVFVESVLTRTAYSSPAC